uniref:Uncharacterized protein n=1 Tax=Mycena chlorophos TaxID=658473 RepID=A0ABQ0M8A5_MYCCL|nr:predicted protein [Mycena chlorophos]
MPSVKRLLPQFNWDVGYLPLHQKLWPPTPQPLSTVPGPLLAECIEEFPALSDFDATELDVRDPVAEAGPLHTNPTDESVRYISLAKHNVFGTLLKLEEDLDGKSLCCYLLFVLLASGSPVFFIDTPGRISYFSSSGVQSSSHNLNHMDPQIRAALKNGWVLIDIDADPAWYPPPFVSRAKCVIWTASPIEARVDSFIRHMDAEGYFMCTWTPWELAAVAKNYNIPVNELKRRIHLHGPIPRSLFRHKYVDINDDVDKHINMALARNLSYFVFPDGTSTSGIQPVPQVFLVEPLVVPAPESGQLVLQRQHYRIRFLSAHIAQKAAFLADAHISQHQARLAMVLDQAATRVVVGKLLEGLIYTHFTKHSVSLLGLSFPSSAVQVHALTGKADSFICEPFTTSPGSIHYLQPSSPNFAAVDSIVFTPQQLLLLQVTAGDSHTRDFGLMLQIVQRLQRLQTGISIDAIPIISYCFVGTERERIQRLVQQADATLTRVKALAPEDWEKSFKGSKSECQAILNKLQVVGQVFVYGEGFKDI